MKLTDRQLSLLRDLPDVDWLRLDGYEAEDRRFPCALALATYGLTLHRQGDGHWFQRTEVGRELLKTLKTNQCSTCGRPYDPSVLNFCSNGFHCCRDCIWEDGRRLKMCGRCQAAKTMGGSI